MREYLLNPIGSEIHSVTQVIALMDLSLISYCLSHHIDALTRPPTRSLPSKIVTLTPLLDRTSAHLSPAKPAPTIQTWGALPGGKTRWTILLVALFIDCTTIRVLDINGKEDSRS